MPTCWSFGTEAERYDALRPRYPAQVTEVLGTVIGPLTGASILEVGAGTGLGTEQLLQAGARVIATEPDAAMRALLERRAPAARILPVRFEEVSERGFDAVVGFQSLHWIAPSSLWRQARRILVPGGVLAGIWQITQLPDPEIARCVSATLAAHGAGHPRGSDGLVAAGMAVLAAPSVLGFEAPQRWTFVRSTEAGASQFAGLLATMSDLLALGPRARACEEELAGALEACAPFEVRFECVVIARRREP